MQQPIKRLGELLIEGGLITPAQLQSALTHQRTGRGRLGSNLVALGYISEEVLLDFLSVQTGMPQLDVRNVSVAPQVLKLVPHRLADQFTVLPITTKEPRLLVLAMSDPSDLNAIDSARFASGLNIEPILASPSALKKAISDLYRQMDSPSGAVTVELGKGSDHEDALSVSFSIDPLPVSIPNPVPQGLTAYPPDPFFDRAPGPAEPMSIDPFGLFDPAPAQGPPASSVDSELIHSRTSAKTIRRLETYQTRTLVLGLIRLLQRRGIIDQDELEHLLANLIEAGEVKDDDRVD
jgi:hypothetical protein